MTDYIEKMKFEMELRGMAVNTQKSYLMSPIIAPSFIYDPLAASRPCEFPQSKPRRQFPPPGMSPQHLPLP